MTGERLTEEWQEYSCSDCDPTLDPSDPGEYEKPYCLLVPKGDPYPDFCPRCGSYLSLLDGASELRITNTPVERWAAQQKAKADQNLEGAQ